MKEFNRYLPSKGVTFNSIARRAWDSNIHTQAENIAANEWNKQNMFKNELAELVVETLKSLQRRGFNGSIADEIYLGFVSSNRLKGNSGTAVKDREAVFVDLTAVWKGAVKLAEDPKVRCVVLENNPQMFGYTGETRLKIGTAGRKKGEIVTNIYLFSDDDCWREIDHGKKENMTLADRRLARRILLNIQKISG